MRNRDNQNLSNPPPKKKTSRHRTEFSANLAASVAVSDQDQQIVLRSASAASLFQDSLYFLTSKSFSALRQLGRLVLASRHLRPSTFTTANAARLSREFGSYLASQIPKLPALIVTPTRRLIEYNNASPQPPVQSKTLRDKILERQHSIDQIKKDASLTPENLTQSIDAELLEQIEMLKNNIIEHAARRVDLFFYLLVAVYDTNLSIEKSETRLQNGKGSKALGTQACHSSLFPNVSLKSLSKPQQATTPLLTRMLAHFMPGLYARKNYDSLEGSHFLESLNATMELPKMVNDFDGHLEGRYQPTRFVNACLGILNKAAKCEIDPIAGMNEFFKTMNQFFIHFEKKYVKKNNADEATKKIWIYQKEGTFKAAQNDLTVDMNYIYLMLRLSNTDILKAKLNTSLLAPAYKKIQDEIFTSPSGRKLTI